MRMCHLTLNWTTFFIIGLVILTQVYGRSTPSSNSGAGGTTADSSTSATTSNPEVNEPPLTTDKSAPEQTTVTSSLTSSSASSAAGTSQAQPRPGEISPAANSGSVSNTGPSRCPSVKDIPDRLCMMQTLQDSLSCERDEDCFISNQICCPHYCERSICKNVDGNVDVRNKGAAHSAENLKPPPDNVVPKNIKHRQNVPTIDELVENLGKKISPTAESMNVIVPSSVQPSVDQMSAATILSNVAQLQPSMTVTASASVQDTVVPLPSTSLSVSNEGMTSSVTSSVSVQPSATVMVASSVTSTTTADSSDSATRSVEGMTSSVTSSVSVQPSATIMVASSVTSTTTTDSSDSATRSVDSDQVCPTVTCSNTCVYGRKVDALGCRVCDCLFNDRCPQVLPIPRSLCTLRLRSTSFTCDTDSDCPQGHICCPGACADNVCRRVVRETFRTLPLSTSG